MDINIKNNATIFERPSGRSSDATFSKANRDQIRTNERTNEFPSTLLDGAAFEKLKIIVLLDETPRDCPGVGVKGDGRHGRRS